MPKGTTLLLTAPSTQWQVDKSAPKITILRAHLLWHFADVSTRSKHRPRRRMHRSLQCTRENSTMPSHWGARDSDLVLLAWWNIQHWRTVGQDLTPKACWIRRTEDVHNTSLRTEYFWCCIHSYCCVWKGKLQILISSARYKARAGDFTWTPLPSFPHQWWTNSPTLSQGGTTSPFTAELPTRNSQSRSFPHWRAHR